MTEPALITFTELFVVRREAGYPNEAVIRQRCIVVVGEIFGKQRNEMLRHWDSLRQQHA